MCMQRDQNQFWGLLDVVLRLQSGSPAGLSDVRGSVSLSGPTVVSEPLVGSHHTYLSAECAVCMCCCRAVQLKLMEMQEQQKTMQYDRQHPGDRS
jgi:hypothetical protein